MLKYSNLQTLSKAELISIVMDSSIGQIKQAHGVCKFFVDFSGLIKNWNKEHFLVLCLNSRNAVIHAEVVTMGILNSSLVHPREVFNIILSTPGTKSFIIGHNHPSGDPEPSEEDDSVTAKLKQAADFMGVPLLDHVIFTKFADYYSYQEKGKI